MKSVLILGGDGYLGWPTAMHFANLGYRVGLIDNLSKRMWEQRMGVVPLFPIETLHRRVQTWNSMFPAKQITFTVGDIATNHLAVYELFESFRPEIIVHYAEQPSAPFSMKDRSAAYITLSNNICGTVNVLFAMQQFVPNAHLIKLGTMGEYGTPGIPIEEGWITITSGKRKARLPFPKLPGSFYHASKVCDSTLIEFAARAWGIKATDLNQGVVYGIDTDHTRLDPELMTSFHYDGVFGTALNRFLAQAVAGVPLTVYGKGGQTRGFLNIRDTLQCVELAARTPPRSGEFRVINQYTEIFSVQELAGMVRDMARSHGIKVRMDHVRNPRVEKERHYYEAKNTTLLSLGLKPHLLTEEVLSEMFERVVEARHLIRNELIPATINWRR